MDNLKPQKKMKPEVKEKWLAALRSGSYEQTNGYLKLVSGDDGYKKVGYCCLGVLADIASKEIPVEKEENRGSSGVRIAFDGNDQFLSPKLQEWAGLDSDNGTYIAVDEDDGEKYEETLVDRNDSGMTFAEIADIIEREF